MTARRKTGRRRRKDWSRDRVYNLFLLGAVSVLAILVILGSQGILRSYVKKHDDGKALSGVYVGNTDISGMTKSEATEAVQKAVADYEAVNMHFQISGGEEIEATLQELGFSAPSVKETVEKAVQYGKKGDTVQAYKTIKKAQKKKLEQHFPLEYEINLQTSEKVLDARAKNFLNVPVNASVTQQEDGIKVIEGKKGEGLNIEKTVRNVNEFLNQDWDGKSGTVQAEVIERDPSVTAEDLGEATDLLGSYTTYYGGGEDGRSKNVESGAMHLNGILLRPGEEQSANAAMEPYTAENGYAEAASYESNTVVQTMGGGICQVSTTLYNALLYAELEIVERYPHSMLVSYAEPSMDAAIADDVLDLVFKNNLDSPVYIETVLAEGNLTFNIYGKETRNPGRQLTFISETTESTQPEGKRFVATEDYIGYIGLQSYAHPEISAQLWKVVTEDGVEVSRDVINYSQYVAAPETYGVGTASENAVDVERMQNAILTQDEATINATIEQILYGPSAQEDAPQENTEQQTW